MNEEIQKLDLYDFGTLIQKLNISDIDLQNKAQIIKIFQNWEDISGPIYFLHSYPLKIQKNILEIVVDHSAYKMEIQFTKQVILKNCNKYFNNEPIKNISIRIGKVPHKNLRKELKTRSFEGKAELTELILDETNEVTKKKLLDLISYL